MKCITHRFCVALLLLAGGLLPISANAQEAKHQVTSEQVKAAVMALDKLTHKVMPETGIPGMAIAVVYQDQVVFAKGYGVRQVGQSEPVDADTVFQLASVSKPIGSTVVAALVGEGKIAWDSHISDLDPGFAMYDPWVTRHLTIRDLYAHRSGLPDHAGDLLEDLGMKHYDRDVFIYETAGENAVGTTGVTFTIGADGKATTVVVENLYVHGEGMFKRVPAQAMAPSVANGDFAGLVAIGGGRKLYLVCKGTGSPTVVFESGYRNDAEIWSAEVAPGVATVLPQVATFTRVCAYDRPGTFLDAAHLSRSDPVPMPRAAQDLVVDLHALLQTAPVPAPYVLVAHAFGGLFARLYASTYPDEVVGMVLVDALSENVRSQLTPEQWKFYVNFGFTQPTPGLEKYKDIETLNVDASFDQMQKAATAKPLRPIPLFVLAQGRPFDLSPWQPLPADSPDALDIAWRAAQDGLATLVPNTKYVIATQSAHYIQIQQPELVIHAVRDVIGAVRDPATWGTLPAAPTSKPTP
jgi:pimeloyl-ACP methyl ester carboxylesterase